MYQEDEEMQFILFAYSILYSLCCVEERPSVFDTLR